jgi:steroid delta-isomerase-like uncharacterized protein
MRAASFLLSSLLISVPAMAQDANQQERNKQIARSFFEEVLDQGHLDRYAESHAPDFVVHIRDHDGTLEEDMAAAREERQAMPDLRMTINEMVAERDLVAVHWTGSGTNTQAGMGFPATGKAIRITGMTLFRFKAGKISEEWSFWDMLSVLRQAGLYPPAQRPGGPDR